MTSKTTIVIGYVPTPVGEAALEAGLEEAKAHGDDVVLLNSPRRRSTVDGEFIDEATADELVARAAAAGVTARVDQSDHGDDIVETFTKVAAATSAPAATPSACSSTSTCRSWPSSLPGEPEPHLPRRRHAGRLRGPAAAQRRRRPPALRPAGDRRAAHRLGPPRPRRDVRRRDAPRSARGRRDRAARPRPVRPQRPAPTRHRRARARDRRGRRVLRRDARRRLSRRHRLLALRGRLPRPAGPRGD